MGVVDMGCGQNPACPSSGLALKGGAATDAGEQLPQLVRRIWELYDGISRLPSLHPSPEVNDLFSQLVLACIPPSAVDVTALSPRDGEMRWRLIGLCGRAEGLLESHYSALLGAFPNPLDHVAIFPYYDNYLQLGLLEHGILSRHTPRPPSRVAFVGSGPLPLTSIVLARHHLRSALFHNYDLDPAANARALRLVSGDPDLAGRMAFHTADIMEVTHALRDYDVVFLAALVGTAGAGDKARVLDHLATYMAPGATLMLRSARGARAFLYPVVDPAALRGFEMLDVFHPDNEVINSVVVARKLPDAAAAGGYPPQLDPPPPQGHRVVLPCKCSSSTLPSLNLNPLNHGSMMEEMALEEQAS